MGFAKIVEYGAFFYRQLFVEQRIVDFNINRLINMNFNVRNIFINNIDHSFQITPSIMKEFTVRSRIYLTNCRKTIIMN